MKILVEAYTWVASTGVITFTGINPVVIERVMLITNVEDGIIIYNFADSAKQGTAATNTLTLDHDTTGMDNGDELQIWYWDGALTGDTTDLLTDTELRASPVPTTESSPITDFATETKQDTIIGHVDGIEALLTTIDGDTSNLDVGLATRAAESGGHLEDIDASLDVNLSTRALEAGGNLASLVSGQLGDGHNVTVDNAGGLEVVQPTAADLNVTEASAAAILADTEALEGALVGPGAPNIDSYSHASINLAAGANQVLVSSAASKQIWVYGIGFTVSAAGSVSFQDEDDLAITGVMAFAANSGLNTPPSGNFAMPIWKLATDKDLEVDIVTADVDGWIDYAIVSV